MPDRVDHARTSVDSAPSNSSTGPSAEHLANGSSANEQPASGPGATRPIGPAGHPSPPAAPQGTTPALPAPEPGGPAESAPVEPSLREELRANGIRHATATAVGRLAQFAVILRTTGSLVGTVVVTSGLGFAFWWVAARGFTPEAVGLSSAVISAMLLLSKLGVMGIGTALVGALPQHKGDRASLIATALLLAAAIGAVLGTIFAILTPLISPGLAALSENVLIIVLFAIGVTFTAIGSVLDQAVIGLLRGSLQLLRNSVFATVKLLAVAAVALAAAGTPDLTIFLAWIGGEAASLLVLGLVVLRRTSVTLRQPMEWGHLLGLGREAVAHHALNVGRFAPSLIMPIAVTTLLSASANAIFYVALLLAAAVQIVSASSTFSLYAVARRDISSLPGQLRFTLSISIAAAATGILVLTLGGELLLGLFGAHYVAGRDAIIVLAITGLPLIAKDHWIAIHRIHSRVGWAAFVVGIGAIIEIGGAVIGALMGGLLGLSLGWLAGILVVAVLMLPGIVRESRSVRPARSAG
jgi:O-antigen/teichoic acid export membrane protein